jgi:transglutaminase-like putative cysteine protease
VRQFSTGSLRLPIFAAIATGTSTVCLGSSFLTGTWFFPSLFAIVFVTAGCEAARRASLSRTAVPLGGLVALLVYLLVRYGHSEAYLGLIPSGASLDRLADLVRSGRLDIERYAAPIGLTPGVELLTVGGVGLVALAVDLLAVTLRRAALAGLPLLVLQTVPTAVAPDGVSWVAFAIGGAGFLALLLAESRERVSRWGRPMRYTAERANYRPDVETTPLAQVGRRVGATALGLALVVPAVLPEVDASGWGFGSGGFGPGGGGGPEVQVANPILDLGKNLRRDKDQVLLSYRGKRTYLRMVALDEFTGQVWQPSELKVSRDENNVEDGLRTPPGLGGQVETSTRSWRIDVGNLEQEWLPLPYPARRVSDIDGTWLYDAETFNVFGENASTLNLSYDVRALEVTPTADQLREAAEANHPSSLRRYLETPSDLPAIVEQEALRVIGNRTNPYDQALAIQDWLRSPDEFQYSTEVAETVGDANGSEALARFLETRQGYCVHFASAMAVMSRLLGIPARVAVGFTAGTPDRAGVQLVSSHDLHSWPELYFDGVGWVAFEPTPAERTGNPPPWAQEDTGSGLPGSTPTPTGAATPNGGATPNQDRTRERTDIPGFQNDPQGGSIGAGPVRIPVVPLLVAVGVLLLLAVPSVTRFVVRRRRWAGAKTPVDKARAAWSDLQDTLLDHGYSWQGSDSPRRGIARLVATRSLDDDASAAGRRLAEVTERTRYAPVPPEAVGDLRADVDAVRRGLGGSAGRWGRWRARLLPRSTRTVATGLSEKLADALDAVDLGVAAVTRRLRLRRS